MKREATDDCAARRGKRRRECRCRCGGRRLRCRSRSRSRCRCRCRCRRLRCGRLRARRLTRRRRRGSGVWCCSDRSRAAVVSSRQFARSASRYEHAGSETYRNNVRNPGASLSNASRKSACYLSELQDRGNRDNLYQTTSSVRHPCPCYPRSQRSKAISAPAAETRCVHPCAA